MDKIRPDSMKQRKKKFAIFADYQSLILIGQANSCAELSLDFMAISRKIGTFDPHAAA